MSIIALPAFNDNYIWAIVNEASHTFTCVDPGDGAPVLAYAKNNNLILSHILITHHHADHTGGLYDLLQAFPATKVYGPADQRIPLLNILVRDEDIIHIGKLAFRVLSTPGHTASHICYQEPTKGWLFCGDTLFSGGCGRVFEGTMEQLYHSLKLLKNLPDDTKIFCGHEYTRQNLRFAATIEPDNSTIKTYADHLAAAADPCSLPSTIALEKQINPFLRTHTTNLAQFAQKQGLNPADAYPIFRQLRELKDQFK